MTCLLPSMAEPAEVLLIRDQYESAFHSLNRGLAAEEAGSQNDALLYYRKGKMHLTQGLEVPTGGERHQGPAWDTARQLQQRMRDALQTVNTRLSKLETPEMTTGSQRDTLLIDLTTDLYPNLTPNSQPPDSSLHHLYPSVLATNHNTTPAPTTTPHRPPPAVPKHSVAAAPTIANTAMANQGDQPPAYTPQPTDGHRSLGYSPAGGGLGSEKQTGQNERELLFIPSGVQLFFVAPNGQVSSLFHPGFLRIIVSDSQQKGPHDERPSAFLHVCDWVYPLSPDTPVLLANTGIYMFPDTLAQTPGTFVGVVLSSELPAADREVFQDLLLQLAELRVQAPEEAGSEVINLSKQVPLGPLKEQTGLTPVTEDKEKLPLPGWSEKMAHGILSGATWLGQEFIKGAEATSRAIHRSGFKIRENVTPEETPREVSPRVSKGLHVAKQASGGAVKVSQFLVNGVSTVAGHVADKMAPHVKKHGTKLIPESMKTSKDGKASNLQGAKHVAVSSLHGFSTVWSSLETGAKLVGKSVSTETVTTVKYKYGEDTGNATDTALKSVVNVGVTAYNFDNLFIKAALKTAGKVKKPGEENEKTEPPNPAGTDTKDTQKKEEEERK